MGWFSKKEQEVDKNAAVGSGLRLYIQKMDPAGVKAALASGADPNGSPQDETSPLVQAASSFTASLPMHRRAQKEILTLLLNAGADPRWGGRDGQSPFELALQKGWVDMVQLMVEKGHPLDVVDGSSLTPLLMVLSPVDYRGQSLIPLIGALLDLGADVNSAGRGQRTPLVQALLQVETLRTAPDYEQMLDLLVQRGASKEDKAPSGESVADLLQKAQLGTLASKWGLI